MGSPLTDPSRFQPHRDVVAPWDLFEISESAVANPYYKQSGGAAAAEGGSEGDEPPPICTERQTTALRLEEKRVFFTWAGSIRWGDAGYSRAVRTDCISAEYPRTEPP